MAISGMPGEDEKLIIRYERLRRRLSELLTRMDEVDQKLIEIEWRLPEDYTYAGDTPLG